MDEKGFQFHIPFLFEKKKEEKFINKFNTVLLFRISFNTITLIAQVTAFES